MIKIEDNPFEILDLILKQLKESTEETPKMQNDLFTLDQLQNISKRDRAIIFEKLERDKYITKRKMSIDKINSSEWDGWYISFEGVILLKSGGYVKQQQRIKVNRKRDGFYLKITAMGGGFAGLYGLFEISKHLYPHLCPFLVAFLHKIYSIFCFC